MVHTPRLFTKRNFCVLIVIVICISSFIVASTRGTSEKLSKQPSQISIIQEEIPYFDGMNSIRAVIGNSSVGVLYPKVGNPQNLYLFTTFTQKIATIEIYNSRGVLSYRTDLIVQNTVIMSLVSITEFNDGDNNSLLNLVEPIHNHTIEFKNVQFLVKKQTETSIDSETEVNYKVSFEASNISYRSHQEKLDHLSFFFELSLQKDRVTVINVPIISIYPRGSQLEISHAINQKALEAIGLTSRLKFSCNISGWDYQTPNSKLLLKVDTLASEQILNTQHKLSGISLTRDILKSTGILGRILFNTDQTSNIALDHDETNLRSYTNTKFTGTRFSVGNSFREFLNFSWSPTVTVDGNPRSVVFQPLFSGQRDLARSTVNTSFLYLTGGFILPQGTDIYYDPEIEFVEINPIFDFLQIPNRSIIQENSIIILISGFFVGVLIIFRSRSTKNIAK